MPPSSDLAGRFRDHGDREGYCEYCGSNYTVGTDGLTEYGHAPDCPTR